MKKSSVAQVVRQTKKGLADATTALMDAFSRVLVGDGVAIERERHNQWLIWNGGAITVRTYRGAWDHKTRHNPLIVRADINKHQPYVPPAALRRVGVQRQQSYGRAPARVPTPWSEPGVEFSVLPDEATSCGQCLGEWILAHLRGDGKWPDPDPPLTTNDYYEAFLPWPTGNYFWSARAARVYHLSVVVKEADENWRKLVQAAGGIRVEQYIGPDVAAILLDLDDGDYLAACALRDWIQEHGGGLAPDLRLEWVDLPDA